MDYRIEKATVGGYTFKRVADTSAVTIPSGFVITAIQAETDCVINTASGNFDANDMDGASISAEGIRYGRYTSLTLTSGIAIVYFGV